jgi:hypothetical protein
MSGREKVVALKVILVLLGVFVGWSVAGYAYVYFTGIGVASDYATGYSIILWLAILGAFGLIAFKVKIRKVTPP